MIVIYGALALSIAAWLYLEIVTGKRPAELEKDETLRGNETSLETLRRAQADLLEAKRGVLFRAKNANLHKKLNDERRFDGRSYYARELNKELESFASQFAEVSNQISYWNKEFDRWRDRAARRSGLRIGLVIFAILFACSYWANALYHFFSIKLPDYGTFPYLSGASAIVSAGLGVVITAASFVLTREKFVDNWERGFADFELGSLGGVSEDQSSWAESKDEEISGGPPKAQATADEHWFQVLDVNADAGIAEISAAYKRLMKQYHPDLVAHMGPKLKKLAEEESRRINSAYEEGQRLIRPAH